MAAIVEEEGFHKLDNNMVPLRPFGYMADWLAIRKCKVMVYSLHLEGRNLCCMKFDGDM